MSERAREWNQFSAMVLEHIDNYVIPQYGDKGEDLVTEWTPEECIRQMEKYVKRFGRNMRPDQELLGLMKVAHYSAMVFSKLRELPEGSPENT